jgi:L-ascorbate metabolism protein UlaG (beta-lactamase superfamily)
MSSVAPDRGFAMPVRAFVVLLLSTLPALSADKPVALRWFGQSCFQIEAGNGKKIVFDPHAILAFGGDKPEADILLLTHEHDDHNQEAVLPRNEKRVVRRGLKPTNTAKTQFDWNKIDETIDGISIKSFGTYHDEEDGKKRGKNGVFIVKVDGITFCHLGDLGHEITEKQAAAWGPIDVLLVPVGGIYTINGSTARKVVDTLKPRLYAVPMHCGVEGYDDLLPAREFLEDYKDFKNLSAATNELLIAPNAPPDVKGYGVVVLGWKKPEKK